jgi:Undecaprenyl-phosphate galactose phosphotransferase WbaP
MDARWSTVIEAPAAGWAEEARRRRAASPVMTGAAGMAADAAAIWIVSLSAAALWSRVNPSVAFGEYVSLWPAPLAFLAAYAFRGLYPGVGISPIEELRQLALANTAVCAAGAAFLFLSHDRLFSRGVLLAAWLLSLLFSPLARALVRNACGRREWWGVPVLVLGAGEAGRRIVGSLRSRPGFGLKPVAVLDDDPDAAAPPGVPLAGPISLAPDWGRKLGVRYALVAMPGLRRVELLRVLEQAGAAFAHVIVIPDLFGMASLWVSARDLGGELGLEIRQNLLIPVNRWLKRALDLAVGAAAAAVSLPLVALAAVWIKRLDPGPAFFRQERGGERGRAIGVWKLRTMYRDADALLKRHLEANPEARLEWRRCFKLKDDPRVLPCVGRFLRRTSLDELPQLWNVLKGEMSLVGPRPFPAYHLDQFDAEFRRLRERVAPGLTGLWQVAARSDGGLRVQQALDTYYIRNWSLWLDLHILARTVRAVLARTGAY